MISHLGHVSCIIQSLLFLSTSDCLGACGIIGGCLVVCVAEISNVYRYSCGNHTW